ncbi:MAG: hypothetical protein J5I93_12275 [Pirellulaceae bacterium]|nr:hypothetical protein [Pirellulaceae bacterium]
MAIVVACRCGQRFQAPDSLAGQRLPCPVCGTPIDIPPQAGASAPLLSDLNDLPPAQPEFAAPYQQQWPQQQSGYRPAASSGNRDSAVGIGVVLAGVATFVCFVIALTLVYVGMSIWNRTASDQPTAAPTVTVESEATASRQWQTFTSEAGGFSIELPGRLDTQASPSHRAALADRTNQVTADLPEGGSVTITWSPGLVPESDWDTQRAMLQRVRVGLVKASNGTLVFEHPAVLNGHLGNEFLVHGTMGGRPGAMWVRCFLIGQDYYQLNWVAGGDRPTPNRDAERVFRSFKLLRP